MMKVATLLGYIVHVSLSALVLSLGVVGIAVLGISVFIYEGWVKEPTLLGAYN